MCYSPDYTETPSASLVLWSMRWSNFRHTTSSHRESPLFGDVSKRHAFYVSAGIMPFNTTTYQLRDTQNALKFGPAVFLTLFTRAPCSRRCGISTNVSGTVSCETRHFDTLVLMSAKFGQFGRFTVVDSLIRSPCSSTDGIYYYERRNAPVHPSPERGVGRQCW